MDRVEPGLGGGRGQAGVQPRLDDAVRDGADHGGDGEHDGRAGCHPLAGIAERT